MTRILNVIQNLGLGGASRALIATAGESRRLAGFTHQVISLIPCDPRALQLARDAGLEVIDHPGIEATEALIAQADIVQVHWWNVPEMTLWLAAKHGPMRLIVYYHVAGNRSPHFITQNVVDYSDLSIACNPYTFEENEVFRQARFQGNGHKVAMVYGAADFSRLKGLQPRNHSGFNVGYIGTVEFHKMHPDFIAMSSTLNIPDLKVLVCGSGGLDILKNQAIKLGSTSRFDIRGYVADIKPVLEILDVYGYPLCEDTYAGSELNLQEAMLAGIPPVVFPHGGVRRLVVHDFTGLVVTTPQEYGQAIEFLYHHPDEKKRLGENARNYAGQIFGATHAAHKINGLYRNLLQAPKRERAQLYREEMARQGADLFLATIAPDAEIYEQSRTGKSTQEAEEADEKIANRSQVVKINGLIPYGQHFPQDPHLHFWLGLMLEREGQSEAAGLEYLAAHQAGLPHTRALNRLARIAKEQKLDGLTAWVEMQLFTNPLIASTRFTGNSDAIPDSAVSEYSHVTQAMEKGDWVAAERQLRKILSKAEASPRLWNDLGVVLYNLGNRDGALSCFNRALEIDSNYPAAKENSVAMG
jgi:glycosyltransferase involved in cell wall biosynthesis